MRLFKMGFHKGLDPDTEGVALYLWSYKKNRVIWKLWKFANSN